MSDNERGPIDREKLEFYRKLLQAQMEDLDKEAENAVVGMTEVDGSLADPTDRAALESDRNFLLRIREREGRLISKIQEAILRIDQGSFGICESCGEDISEERLAARPVATLCVDCKKQEESKQKARGK